MAHLLFVDDDEKFITMYRIYFESKHDAITTALDGETGLEHIQSIPFDCIVLDIMLPKLTGIDLIDKIQEIPNPNRSCPIIVLSNLAYESIRTRIKPTIRYTYLEKTLTIPETLYHTIHHLINPPSPKSENL